MSLNNKISTYETNNNAKILYFNEICEHANLLFNPEHRDMHINIKNDIINFMNNNCVNSACCNNSTYVYIESKSYWIPRRAPCIDCVKPLDLSQFKWE